MTPIEIAERIKTETAYSFGVTPDSLEGRSRRKTTAMARCMAMVLVDELTEYSSGEISHWFFGGREHSTVLHAKDRHSALCATVPSYEARYQALRVGLEPKEEIRPTRTLGAHRCNQCNRFVAGGHECNIGDDDG